MPSPRRLVACGHGVPFLLRFPLRAPCRGTTRGVKAILLGTAGAWPIPRPGCRCPQCEEARADSAYARTRTGLLVEAATERVLIDAGPDIARQLEGRSEPPRIDRVVITHRHLDHVLGIDDLVHVREDSRGCLPIHVAESHREKLGVIFRHLLREPDPRIRFEPWETGARLEAGEITLEGFETGHRERFPTTGVVLHVPAGRGTRRIAFATDMGDDLPSPRSALEGVDLFVVDGTYLGEGGYGHPGTDRAIAMARDLGARRVAITHVGHWQVAHAEARARIESSVAICRDGDDLLRLLDAPAA